MMRGTFANIRIKNQMLPGVEGGFTKGPDGTPDGDLRRRHGLPGQAGTPLVIFAGKEYGTGSCRDWAAKGTNLLGVRAVIAQSFERIHRSNLVGMGVIPLQFKDGESWQTLGLDGTETIDIEGVDRDRAARPGRPSRSPAPMARALSIETRCRIDTANELDYYKHGGILHYVLRSLVAA